MNLGVTFSMSLAVSDLMSTSATIDQYKNQSVQHRPLLSGRNNRQVVKRGEFLKTQDFLRLGLWVLEDGIKSCSGRKISFPGKIALYQNKLQATEI